MPGINREARNEAIRLAYGREPVGDIADRYGLTRRYVRTIARGGAGASRPPASREEHRAATLEGIRLARASGRPLGRPRLFADDPEKRQAYETLSSHYGHRTARLLLEAQSL